MPEQARVVLVRTPATPLAAHVALLSAEERQRMEARRGAERQARFACAHALLRCELATALHSKPEQVQLEGGEHGRPQLAGSTPAAMPALDFNLSSTPGWAACIIGVWTRVGIDVQTPDPAVDTEALARRLYTEKENTWRREQSGTAGFYRLWTLKESLAKAHGEGLGLPFRALETLPVGDHALQLELTAIGEAAGNWVLLMLDAPVPAAISVRRCSASVKAREPFEIHFAQTASGPFQPVPVTVLASHPPAF